MKVCLNCGYMVMDDEDKCPECSREVKVEEICQPPIKETNNNKEE